MKCLPIMLKKCFNFTLKIPEYALISCWKCLIMSKVYAENSLNMLEFPISATEPIKSCVYMSQTCLRKEAKQSCHWFPALMFAAISEGYMQLSFCMQQYINILSIWISMIVCGCIFSAYWWGWVFVGVQVFAFYNKL